MTDVVISEFINTAALDELRADFDVLYDETFVERRDDLLRSLAGARALVVRNRTRVDAALLDAGPKLRVIGRLGVGLDNIDLAACRTREVLVVPATGANVLSVAEYVVTTTMMLLRGCFLASTAVAAGQWPRARLLNGRETSGKVLGIIGVGAIGRAVASRAAALGMRVVATDPALSEADPIWHDVERMPLAGLLAASDAVTLHVPLVDSTRHLIDAAAIAQMKPEAVLINTARGGVVDEAALATALTSGRLAAAALDVFEDEPLAADSRLARVPNILLTPHVAGLTRESNERVGAVVAQGVAEALRK